MTNKLAKGVAVCVLQIAVAQAATTLTKSSVPPAASPRPPAPRTTAELQATWQPLIGVFSEQNRRSHANWSSALTDIARHLPSEARYTDAYGRYIQAGDLVTAGHEWTHFINEFLTLKNGAGVSSYYLMNNQFVTLADPEGMRGHVPAIPASLQADLYQLYFVQNGSNASVDPLYLFDEWVAYGNDVSVAISQLEARKPLNAAESNVVQTKTAGNLLEFTFYGFAVGEAVKRHDPIYYAGPKGKQLRDFISLNARRSLDIYEKALLRRELSADDTRNASLLRAFRTSADAARLRAWVRNDLNNDLADRLMRTVGATPNRLADAGSIHLQ